MKQREETLDLAKRQMFKDVELALSYADNPEYKDYNELAFKQRNGKTVSHSTPRNKLSKLVQLAISKYMEKLDDMNLPVTKFNEIKRGIINELNDRYFGENNEYMFRVKDRAGVGISVTDNGWEKFKRRAEKDYVNQNSPNKDTFFVYSMADITEMIEELMNIKLSVHAVKQIEGIVNASVEQFKRDAEYRGNVTHHAIAHGLEDDAVKLIEKYINSRKNLHIKEKFHFSTDASSKLAEIIKRENERTHADESLKGKNVIKRIGQLKL